MLRLDPLLCLTVTSRTEQDRLTKERVDLRETKRDDKILVIRPVLLSAASFVDVSPAAAVLFDEGGRDRGGRRLHRVDLLRRFPPETFDEIRITDEGLTRLPGWSFPPLLSLLSLLSLLTLLLSLFIPSMLSLVLLSSSFPLPFLSFLPLPVCLLFLPLSHSLFPSASSFLLPPLSPIRLTSLLSRQLSGAGTSTNS